MNERGSRVQFIIFFVLTVLLAGASPSVATDTEGCLTCHRYPGLVKFEKPDSFRVLHIDEETHLASPHGKVDCQACHPTVLKVPHTGETSVDCTNTCHDKDREKIASLSTEELKTYHQNEKFAITRIEGRSSCSVCHPLYPHSSNNKVRALINMHTGFLHCEVCHLKKEVRGTLVYTWADPERFEFTGKPYGTHVRKERPGHPPKKSLIARMLNISSPDEKADKSAQHEYFLSRISVFEEQSGKKISLRNTRDIEKAEEFVKKQPGMREEDRKKELSFFHRGIAKKEISTVCNECHTPSGMLDFEKLGFDKKRATDLQYMNIKSLITKYDTFYFPRLFNH